MIKKIIVGCCLLAIQCNVYLSAKDYPIRLINQSSQSLLVQGSLIDGEMNLLPQIIQSYSELSFKVWNTNLLALRARGLITVTNMNDQQQECRFEYNNHSIILSDELRHMDLDPGFIKNTTRFCASLFTSHGNKSICHGANNCMVVNDNIEQAVYNKNKNKVLSKNLWLGTHNSVIAKSYAQGKNILNVSNVDPNQTLTLTEQLDQGVRVLELDLVEIQKQLQFCHFHVDKIPYSDVCDENTTFKTGLQEINHWHEQHPGTILFIYLDMNQPIHNVANLDTIIANSLQDKTGKVSALSKLDIGDTLPLNALTPNDLTLKLGKSIVFINHDSSNIFDAHASTYVFNQVDGNLTLKVPYDRGIDSFTNCQDTFSQDNGHNSLWGLRGDQTLLSGKDNTRITYTGIENIPQDCFVNYIALDKLIKHDTRISAIVDLNRKLII